MGKPLEFVVPDSVDSVSITLPDGISFNWNKAKALELTTADKAKLVITGSDLHFTAAVSKPAVNTESAPAAQKTGKRKYTRKNKVSKKKDAAKAPAAETNTNVDPAYAKKVTDLGFGPKSKARTYLLKSLKINKIKTIEDLVNAKLTKMKKLGPAGKELIKNALEKYVAKHPRDVKAA